MTPTFAIGQRVRHRELPLVGRVVEVPATFAGEPMPGWIRVRVEDGVYSTDSVAHEERWVLDTPGDKL